MSINLSGNAVFRLMRAIFYYLKLLGGFMRLSKYYMPTLREVPADAEIPSHQLMLRAGMIRKTCSGIYSYLPLGLRVLRKVEEIVRRNMDEFGGQEIRMSIVQPKEIWEASGRWEKYGPELFKLKDRAEQEFCLGPTAEEYFSFLVANELNSYKQLPLNLYQFQIKYRDEKRPRFGLNRSREFLMKDAYSFDVDREHMIESYHNMEECYDSIFTEIGLDYVKVDSDSGQMGGNLSIEFQALSEIGEGELLYTKDLSYAANREKCPVIYKIEDNSEMLPVEKVHTPGAKTIEEVSKVLNTTANKTVKMIDLNIKGKPYFVMIPGDRELNMVKLVNFLDVNEFDIEMMDDEMIKSCNSHPGFSGPIGLKGEIIMDSRIKDMRNFVVGANEEDYHLINVNYGRDFEAIDAGDLLNANEGDLAPNGHGELLLRRGIEVGQIFGLGTKYAEAEGAYYLDENGKRNPIYMGSYGVGVSRTITAVIEQNHDDYGIIWPLCVAPFEIIITTVNIKDEDQRRVGEELYEKLSKDYEVLFDDRVERAGIKFNDRDLIGIPLRITVGKSAKDGVVEFSKRSDMENREELAMEELYERIKEEIK